MADENQDDGLMRRYLLSQLAEDERQQFEEAMMADNELYNRVLLVEDEMVEEYLQGELSESERAGFEASFLSTVEGRKQVSFAKALSEYVSRASASEGSSAVSAPEKPARVEPARVQPARVTEEAARMTDERAPTSRVRRPVWWSRPALVPYFRLASAAVIVLAAGLGTWNAYVYFQHSQVSKGIASLREAYRDQRPNESRITELNYAPPPPTTRGPERDRFDYVALDRAKALIQVEASEHPSAQSYHDLGRLYLAQGDFDKAIDQFEKALKSDPNNAQLHSDYGAALLEKGKDDLSGDEPGKSLEEFAASLEHLNMALDLDDGLLESRFNRALLYQYMMLPQQAAADWHKYLEKDSSSKWAEEARQGLRQIEEQKEKESQGKGHLFQDFTSAYEVADDDRAWKAFSTGRARVGNVVTKALLDAFLRESTARGGVGAHSALQILGYAGQLESRRVGDHFTDDLAGFYGGASARQRQLVAEARRLLEAADERIKQTEYEQAIELYEKARLLLKQAGDSAETAFVESRIGIANLRIDSKKALAILEPLSQSFDRLGYKYLLAQSLNGIADAQSSHRDFSKTLESGRRAYEVSEQIEDLSGMLRNLHLPVAMHQQFGDYRESLGFIRQAFDVASRLSPEPGDIWTLYHEAALDLHLIGFSAAALDFQNEAVRLANESGTPLLKSRAYARLGLIHEQLNHYDEAIRNGELALAEGQRISGERSRANAVANSTLNLAHSHRQNGDLSQALTYYDRAIQLHEQLDIQIYTLEAHRGRLQTLIGLNDDSGAEREVTRSVALIDEYRPRIWAESNRNSFFDLAQSIYDIAIDFSYSQMKNGEQAFEYTEASHARSLLDLLNTNAKIVSAENKQDIELGPGVSPLSLSKIQQQLPEEAQILEYSVLDDKVLIWLVSKTGVVNKSTTISVGVLNEKVRQYLDLISTPIERSSEAIANKSRELFDLLIDPVSESLNPNSYMCIVPDKILNRVPFGALVSPRSGKYFVEDHLFVLAPSSNIFLACSGMARKKERVDKESVLSVGDPSFDRVKFGSLPDLPSAAREAKEIAACYESADVLLGERATEGRVRAAMKRADVIHVAAHYVVDERSPMLSKLLLAKEQGSGERARFDGVLQASEIYEMDSTRARLVVLSACRTGIERSYRGEGAISMARPFIKAGVPIVVATLWSVESESTADLMISFQRHRKHKGVPTGDALRGAQLDMLRSPHERSRHPHSWAGFETIGGYTRF
ncbi:MAG: CHAT domain-containing protein [Acidobacteriota bacterium]